MDDPDVLYQMCVAFLLIGASADDQVEKDEWLHRAMVASQLLEASYAAAS